MTIMTEHYFSTYAGDPSITDDMMQNAERMLTIVNELRALAAADGVQFTINPATGTFISGNGNGGYRVSTTTVGAPKSMHKQGRAVDSFDPQRRFASWCLANRDRLREAGLHMEDPRWTPTWVHLQNVPPASGNIVFVPSTQPPLVDAPSAFV